MFAIMDVWHTILGIVHSADMITLGLMAVVAIAAGFMMQELGSIISTTIVALVVFALLTFLRAVVLQHADISGLATADWKAFQTMQMLVVFSYAVLFGVVIAVVSTVRGLVLG
jgi:hypothetical protein